MLFLWSGAYQSQYYKYKKSCTDISKIPEKHYDMSYCSGGDAKNMPTVSRKTQTQ